VPLTTYLYKMRAVGPGGNTSGFSNVDAATVVNFTDDSLPPAPPPALPIKAVHMSELRVAVNAMRLAAGLTSQPFTPLTAGVSVVKAEDIREMRRGLNQARAWIGLPPMVYVDPGIAARTRTIKSRHIYDLRIAVK
jgi:hypothetical protein